MGGSGGLTDLLAEFQAWERPCLKKVDGTRGYSLASILLAHRGTHVHI